MTNSLVSRAELGKLDAYMRQIINEALAVPPLFKYILYTSRKF
jgi:hypothetical protein